jgi:hypothetical protein
MAPRTIRLGGEDNAPEAVEVYLFEHKYLLRRHTRSVEMKLDKANKKLNEALRAESDPGGDKVITAFGEGLAVLLMNNGTESPDPKKVIIDSWKADKLDLQQIGDLYDELQEVQAERPT